MTVYYRTWAELSHEEGGGGEDCRTIGCISVEEQRQVLADITNTPEYVHILYTHFLILEGEEDDMPTNEIVSLMTKFIKENSFELTFEGMDLKFTSLAERNVYNETQIRGWCRQTCRRCLKCSEFRINCTILGEEALCILDLSHKTLSNGHLNKLFST